jgi:glutamine amidotransferase
MCRHLAYLGPAVTLGSLLYDPPHSLVRQSWAPRQQHHGTVNADGYGVAWYAPERSVEPARYRRAGPIWADRSLPSMARAIASEAVMAAVRSATAPAPSEESGAAPFSSGPWLWSLNGAVFAPLEPLRRSVSVERAAQLEGSSDAEVLFALVLDRLDAGDDPPAALAWLVAAVPGRLNVLLADGRHLWATRWGDTLWWRPWRGGHVVGSEPFDDDPAWVPVPDRSLVSVSAGACSVTALPKESHATHH